jgi:hypothetical protein
MTKPNTETAGQAAAAEGKRPWGTPEIIISTLARHAGTPTPTSVPFADSHGSSTTLSGS